MFVVMATDATEAEILGVKSLILAEGLNPFERDFFPAETVEIRAATDDEGPRRRMRAVLGALRSGGLLNGFHQIKRCQDRRHSPLPDNGLGDRPRARFLAKQENNLRQQFRRRLIDHIGGRLPGLGHAHIQRPRPAV